MTKTKYNYLFLDTNARATVVQIREIKRYFKENSIIYVLDTFKNSPSKYSKYVDHYYNIPVYDSRYLQNFIQEKNINFVMMSDEKTIHFFAANGLYDYCNKNKIFVSPYSYDHFATVSNKFEILEIAKKVGLKYPKTIKIGNDITAISTVIVEDLSFPLVIKPVTSIQNLKKWDVIYAKNKAELILNLNTLKKQGVEIVVQEYIDGNGYGYESITDINSNVIAHFGHKRLRELHVGGGGSTYCTSYIFPQEDVNKFHDLLKELQFTGPSMIELKKGKDGQFYLMEVNARFWGSLPLAIESGVNFPVIWIKELLKTTQQPVLHYNKKYFRWIFGDLNHLFEVLIGRKDALGRKFSRIKTCISFFKLSSKDTTYLNLNKDDWKCLYGEFKQKVF